ncbi:MAG: hypothetical protein M0R46_00580 [Candidatus Muirbacterium halophilum]|nr:hypothetical protein [Candidatus Muirbacterium halophilum]MCK9474389.1 hypothetical protein [Candidatus Muirbacterium halophilum]
MKKIFFLLIVFIAIVYCLSGKDIYNQNILIGNKYSFVVLKFNNIDIIESKQILIKDHKTEENTSGFGFFNDNTVKKVLFLKDSFLIVKQKHLEFNGISKKFNDIIFDCDIYKDNIILCTENSVFVLDDKLNNINVLKLPIKKNAHDIMIKHNILYLLDNIMFPYHIFKISINDLNNLKLIEDIKVNLVNGHLNTQFIENNIWNFTSQESNKRGSFYSLNKVINDKIERIQTGSREYFPEEKKSGYKIVNTYIDKSYKYEVRYNIEKDKNILVIIENLNKEEIVIDSFNLGEKVFFGKINENIILISSNSINIINGKKIINNISTLKYSVKTVDYVDFLL